MYRENPASGNSRIDLLVNDCNIYAEVANTPVGRAQGLMHRDNLGPDCGMLFVFPDLLHRSFWMKETHMPLSIAYLSEQGVILNIADMEPHNLEGVKSKGAASYALEMTRGWFDQNGILTGDKVKGLPTDLVENKIRAYVRSLLMESLITEKELRGQKSKRTMYHIGKRPASPKPAERWGEKGGWTRAWVDEPVKSGVFVTENPTDVAQYHGVSGNVYAYKVPEWVIAKAGGKHRFDNAGELLISQELWDEAGDEIELLGKTMEPAMIYGIRLTLLIMAPDKEREKEQSITSLRNLPSPA